MFWISLTSAVDFSAKLLLHKSHLNPENSFRALTAIGRFFLYEGRRSTMLMRESSISIIGSSPSRLRLSSRTSSMLMSPLSSAVMTSSPSGKSLELNTQKMEGFKPAFAANFAFSDLTGPPEMFGCQTVLNPFHSWWVFFVASAAIWMQVPLQPLMPISPESLRYLTSFINEQATSFLPAMADDFAHEFQVAHCTVTQRRFASLIELSLPALAIEFDQLAFLLQAQILPQNVHANMDAFFQSF